LGLFRREILEVWGRFQESSTFLCTECYQEMVLIACMIGPSHKSYVQNNRNEVLVIFFCDRFLLCYSGWV
jgi:hypothetical protein